jgi:hypothetical protein
MKPTYEELEAKVQRLEELLRQALEKIAKLEQRLGVNSKNSSKPPSADQKGDTVDAGKKPPRATRAGKSRPSFPPDKIDRHVQCGQDNCPHCGSLKIQLNGQSSEILQQAELPEIRAIITEFQLQKYYCEECGKNSTAPLPPGVPDSAFGPKLMGLLATLTGVLHVAKREATQLIKDLYGIDMGVGSVPNVEERVAAALDPVYGRIHKFVVQHKFCTHFDETGWRDRGKRHFVWLATCQKAAVYRIDRNRSAAAFQRLIGREKWVAPAVTDRYAVYSSFKDHQFCLAHLIREFKRHGEREGPDKIIGLALEKELRLSCRIHREYREGKSLSNGSQQPLKPSGSRVEMYFALYSKRLSAFTCRLCLLLSQRQWAFSPHFFHLPTKEGVNIYGMGTAITATIPFGIGTIGIIATVLGTGCLIYTPKRTFNAMNHSV